MKQLAMVVVAVIALTTQAQAVTQKQFAGSCAWPFAVPMWHTVVEFNDAGIPVRASGICCDGTAWTANLLAYGGSGGTGSAVNATLHWSNDMIASVSADQSVDFRIVDLRTGNYVSPAYPYSPGGQMEMNISTLSVGVYGIAVIQNEITFNLLTFAKLQ